LDEPRPMARDGGSAPIATPATTEVTHHGPIALALVLVVLLAIGLRLFVSAHFMNLYVAYTDPGTGGLFEKFHIGTYAILLTLVVALFLRPIYLVGDEIAKFRALLRFMGFCVLIFVFLLFVGTGRAPAAFIDSYAVAAAAGLLLFTLNPASRIFIGNAVVAVNVAGALLALVQVAIKSEILPYSIGDLTFRPIGLTEHPLTLGIVCAGTIAFVPLTTWPTWTKGAAIVVLFMGLAAAGARFALLVTCVEAVALIMFSEWSRLSPRLARLAKITTLLAALVIGGILLAIAAAGGLLSRFEGGVVDANAFARIDIYRIFSLTTPQQILFGADLNVIADIVKKKIGLPFIESSVVLFTFQMGAILAIIFAVLLLRLLLRLLKGQPVAAWIGTVAIIVTGLSNNTFSTKNLVIPMLVVLLVTFGAGNKEHRLRSSARKTPGQSEV
jgi:hypothetical protein